MQITHMRAAKRRRKAKVFYVWNGFRHRSIFIVVKLFLDAVLNFADFTGSYPGNQK